jgi:hypothetical protein
VSKSSTIQAHTDKYNLVGALDPDTDEIKPVNLGDGTVLGLATQLYVWNTVTLVWDKMVQPYFSLEGDVEVDTDALEALVEDTLQQHFMDDFDVSGNPIYVGYQRKDGEYYIQRFNTTTGAVDYTAGSSNYSTAWTNRASETYADFATTF